MPNNYPSICPHCHEHHLDLCRDFYVQNIFGPGKSLVFCINCQRLMIVIQTDPAEHHGKINAA